ncbi:MAG: HypC/HybG/HupF family hydrogenase formation chaperone [Candidatus Woesearchaeota archaeon]
MCLAIPGKVIELKGKKATVDYETEKREADNSLINSKKGDYVLVSGGFVVEIIPEEKARKAIAFAKKL